MKDDKRLKEKLDHAIQNDDFKDVSEAIEKSVENAIYYTKVGVGAAVSGFKRGLNRDEEAPRVNRDPAKVAQKVTSPNAWYWLRAVAGLGTVGSGVLGIMFLLSAIFSWDSDLIFGALFFIIAALALAAGTVYVHRNYELTKDFYRIRREIGDRAVLATDDVVTALAKPKSAVVEELNAMIRKDFLPQGRLVEGGDLLLLDRVAYDAYKDHYRGRNVEVQQTPRHLDEAEEPLEDDRAEALGRCRDKLQKQVRATDSPELQEKIRRLQKIVDAIDHAVATDPARVEELNKFTDYYAPTTIKLIQRYLEFESSEVITDSIRATMTDILHSLDTVTGAYEKLLDTLYKDDLIELQAEMNVMETVLKQDGFFDETKGE